MLLNLKDKVGGLFFSKFVIKNLLSSYCMGYVIVFIVFVEGVI